MTQTTATLLIHNARLVLVDRVVESGWLLIDNGKIVSMGESSDDAPQSSSLRVDAGGQWLIPGFIDMHIHGGDGFEVMDGTAKSIRSIGRFHAAHGTTGWLPTTLTAPIEALQRAISAVNEVCQDVSDGADVLGIHLEGPFISPDKCGAQNPAYVIPPSIDILDQLTSMAPGLVRKVTIAPEREGALDAIRWMAAHQIIASMGHTDGTMAQTFAGIAAGARHATHLFNAMRGLHHREGGTVGASLLSDEVICELIADGHHVEPDVMKLVYEIKGSAGIALITDAMAATGRPDGAYKLGGLDVTVENGIALLTKGNSLAGSTLTMDVAVRNMVSRVGVDVVDAVRMAATTPARELGMAATKGSLDIGKDADLVLLDEAFTVIRTFVNGKEVYQR